MRKLVRRFEGLSGKKVADTNVTCYLLSFQALSGFPLTRLILLERKLHLVSFLPVLTHDRFSLHLLKMATLPEKMLYIVLVLEVEKREEIMLGKGPLVIYSLLLSQ